MDATLLSAIAGVILTLTFSYVPKAREWFEKLGTRPDGKDDQGTAKRLVMLAMLLLVTLGIFAISCLGWVEMGVYVVCGRAGIIELLRAFLAAIVANQSIYKISPK